MNDTAIKQTTDRGEDKVGPAEREIKYRAKGSSVADCKTPSMNLYIDVETGKTETKQFTFVRFRGPVSTLAAYYSRSC